MTVNTKPMGFKAINGALREAGKSVTLTDVIGQRFIATGMSDKTVTISGVPGNALGAYLNGGKIIVRGNAQDAVGDTMNAGEIIIHGNTGDAAGYAMRGGSIYVKGNAGYRAGIHMKAYKEKIPVMVIGGNAGSFLGEYQAGGVIVVLGLHGKSKRIVGNFPCTGMHGGKMILRSDCGGIDFPDQVSAKPAAQEELKEIKKYVAKYCRLFGDNPDSILNSPFTVVTPNSKNPYKQLYVAN